jgi:amidase
MSGGADGVTGAGIRRRDFLRLTAVSGAALAVRGLFAAEGRAESSSFTPPPFEFEEATIDDLQKAMASGSHTSRALVEAYLKRIDAVDRDGAHLRAVLEVNPEALSIADDLDKERKAKGARGPLHGIPVLLKDNINTGDRMSTSAGSLALGDQHAKEDAPLAHRLREAGAVILGKTNLSEWANFRSTRSISGWSGRGGQTRNPYALSRNPCGSSSGSGAAVAANLTAVAVGTETDGSIMCPSSTCGIVGLKPTVGLVSRTGVVPISHTQDTAGPMGRTVKDVAILLGALSGADSRDAATRGRPAGLATEFAAGLDPGGAKGMRLGVARKFFGFSPDVDEVMKHALAALKDAGAVLVDPVDLPTSAKFDASELEVLLYEFKADLNAYLAKAGPGAAVKTLAELIQFNEKNKDKEMPFFGQELLTRAEAKGPLTSPEYHKALATCRQLARAEGIDLFMTRHHLDALLAPSNGPAWITDFVNGDHFTGGSSSPAAVAGYPSVTVPAGFVFGLPVGLSFIGRAWSEAKLLKIAYAFEQATKARKAPGFPGDVEA